MSYVGLFERADDNKGIIILTTYNRDKESCKL